MSRSGYTDEYGDEYPGQMELFRANVDRAIRGKRGQAFLREMLDALDAMPEKRLITGALVCDAGVCAMGAVAVARGPKFEADIRELSEDYESGNADEWDHGEHVANVLRISAMLAREIAWQNDEGSRYFIRDETPEQRWTRMRAWIVEHLEAAP